MDTESRLVIGGKWGDEVIPKGMGFLSEVMVARICECTKTHRAVHLNR